MGSTSPGFRNLGGSSNTDKFIRGYGYQGGASRGSWEDSVKELSHGKALKEAILKPGGWNFGMGGFGEVLPYEDNRMTLGLRQPGINGDFPRLPLMRNSKRMNGRCGRT